MKKKSLRHMSVENRLFYLFNSVFWIVIMFIVIYPLYLICIASISDPDAVAKGQVLLLPVDISFIGYKAILKDSEIWVGYVNSLFYVASSVVLSVIVTLCAAYSLSRKNLSGKMHSHGCRSGRRKRRCSSDAARAVQSVGSGN